MIRIATAADAAALAALRRAWVEENAGAAVEDDAFEADFASWFATEERRRVTWLAEVEGAPVAMLNLTVFQRMPRPGLPPSRWGYLGNFFVRADHRDAGLGAALLAACTAYADEHGFVRIVLSPSERSVPLYLRAGFGPATSLLLRPGPG
ncbi:MAG: GNAT family N-acetyltransferase [Marmoricola sp.]